MQRVSKADAIGKIMYEEKLVSVIVPIYNVEDYLRRCVRSILNQSYRNLEIILVDDGSTDGSGAICDFFSGEDDRVSVIHQPNGGLSAARNAGIDFCRGEYVCFVDSDDYVHPDYVAYLYRMCILNKCDIGICGFVSTSEDNCNCKVNLESEPIIYSAHELLDLFYSEEHVPIVAAWNKIYKRECIGDIRYDVGRIHEDEGTTFKFLYNSPKIAFGKEALYYYYDRADSITGNSYSLKNLDVLKAFENRLIFYKEHNEMALLKRECQFYLSEILTNYYKVYKKLDKDKDILTQLKTKYDKAYCEADRSDWGISRKFLYSVCRVFPLLYGIIKFRNIK